jgi:hypothetical protein
MGSSARSSGVLGMSPPASRDRAVLARDELGPGRAQRNAARQAERRLVVYLDETQRRWLRGVEADALRDDVRLSASAIVRLAIDELRSQGVRWQNLADGPPVETSAPDGDPATEA